MPSLCVVGPGENSDPYRLVGNFFRNCERRPIKQTTPAFVSRAVSSGSSCQGMSMSMSMQRPSLQRSRTMSHGSAVLLGNVGPCQLTAAGKRSRWSQTLSSSCLMPCASLQAPEKLAHGGKPHEALMDMLKTVHKAGSLRQPMRICLIFLERHRRR